MHQQVFFLSWNTSDWNLDHLHEHIALMRWKGHKWAAYLCIWIDIRASSTSNLLLMEEILHQLIGSLSHNLFTRFYTSQVVQDFFHQQYHMQTDCKRDDNVRGPSVQDFGLDDHGFSHYQEFGFTFLTTHMYVYCKYDLNMYFKYIYIIHIICFQCDSNAHIYTCVFSACFPVIQGRSHDYRSCFSMNVSKMQQVLISLRTKEEKIQFAVEALRCISICIAVMTKKRQSGWFMSCFVTRNTFHISVWWIMNRIYPCYTKR